MKPDGWTGLFLMCAAAGALADGAPLWQEVPGVPADPTAASLFLSSKTVDDFEAADLKWRASKGKQNAAAAVSRDTSEPRRGAAALKVAYTFEGNRDFEYVLLESPVTVEKAGMGLGFWLKSDGTPFHYKVRMIDPSGETHQLDLLCEPRKAGWQFVAVALNTQSQAWGGDGNQHLDYPCRLGGILIDRPAREFSGQGALWLDDVAVLDKRRPSGDLLKLQTVNPVFGNVYAAGERVPLKASGAGERIRWRLEDYWGTGVAAGQGRAAGTEASFTLDRPGYFLWTFELLSGDETLETVTFPCAALPGGRVAAASDFLGMCTHFGHGSYPLESMTLLRRYGIDQFRDEISWRDFEKTKGQYAMPELAAKFLRHAQTLSMRPLLIYDYANPLYDNNGFPNSDAAIAAFAAYAVELTRATRGQVSQFEVWNEWCGGCGMRGRPGVHDGPAYGRLLKPVYAAVKQAFPDVTVVGMGGEYGTHVIENLVGAVGTAGPDAMDAWSIHPYRYPRPPEESDLAGEVRRIADRLAEAGVKSPAWVTEIGYPTQLDARGSTPAEQARHAVRTAIGLQGCGRVGKLFWYDFKDDGLDRGYNENNFGVVRHQKLNCAPKPAAVALATWIRLTDGAAFRSLTEAGGLWTARYAFADGEELLVAWTAAGERSCRVAGQAAQGTDLMGAPLRRAERVTLSPDPLYLRGRGLSLAAE